MTTARILAAVAALLAVGALAMQGPWTPRRATVDIAALAAEVDHEKDHLSVAELRERMAKGKVRIIDLRSPEEYAAGHIPSAENVPLARIHEASVRRDEPIVLYSAGGIHSAQAWFFMRARGVEDVRFLKGGFDEWRDSDAPPAPPPSAATAPPASAAPSAPAPVASSAPVRARAPRAPVGAPVKPAAVEAPAPTEAPPPSAAPKKPREGC